MERKFLEELNLEKEVIDKIWSTFEQEITRKNAVGEALQTENNGLKKQLEDANQRIQTFEKMDVEGIQKAVEEWKGKYDSDTAALKEQLAAKDYEFAAREHISGLKFSSKLAQRAFLADLTGKGLPLQDGKLLGFEDFVQSYRETDPEAFAGEEKTPVAVRGTSRAIPDKSPSEMTYTELCAYMAERPQTQQ